MDTSAIQGCQVLIICVPTPLRKTKDPDLSYIIESVENIQQHMQHGTLVILESTTYPGTTKELVCPLLESNGWQVGKDFFLAFSPERIDPGPSHVEYTIRDVPKVVGGVTDSSTRVAKALYSAIIDDVVAVSSSKVAEMVKLLENTYRSVNIGLVNELALMCHELDVNVWEVIEAAATKPYGFQPFYPGPGLGGHCIPIDPFYLAWKARTHGFEPRFIDLAGQINSAMPLYIVRRITDLLNDKTKPLRGSKIHLIGVAYKKDVADTRESPAIVIITLLLERGCDVSFSDPYVDSVKTRDGRRLDSVPIDDAPLESADCVVIVTDHSQFPWDRIATRSPLILDTRNALKKFAEDHIHTL
jgi:UDP-N-acetyl-D-glucosamine dehydrogenase